MGLSASNVILATSRGTISQFFHSELRPFAGEVYGMLTAIIGLETPLNHRATGHSRQSADHVPGPPEANSCIGDTQIRGLVPGGSSHRCMDSMQDFSSLR